VNVFGKEANSGDVPGGCAVARIHPDGNLAGRGVPGSVVVRHSGRVDAGVEADLEAVGLECLDPVGKSGAVELVREVAGHGR
jgi:hypothetical protein